jgi:Uma2 family endonuclease
MIAVMQADLARRLTVEEYFRMAEVGLLAPDARVELIEGEIIDMAPVGTQHAGLMGDLVLRIARDLGDRVCVWDQATLPLGKSSAPQPDIALLKYRKDRYKSRYPSPDDVLLVVEVSQSSLRHDREVKLPLYARHDIPEVWLVDVDHRLIHFFHTPKAEQYTHASSTSSPGCVSLQALSGAALDLTGLLEDLEIKPMPG